MRTKGRISSVPAKNNLIDPFLVSRQFWEVAGKSLRARGVLTAGAEAPTIFNDLMARV
jgi:hypothetical protein